MDNDTVPIRTGVYLNTHLYRREQKSSTIRVHPIHILVRKHGKSWITFSPILKSGSSKRVAAGICGHEN